MSNNKLIFLVQKALVENLELELKKLNNKVEFIRLVVEKKIEVRGRKKAELCLELQRLGFDPFPKQKRGAEPAAVGAIDDEEENEEIPDDPNPTDIVGSEYDYLLSMSIGTLTVEKRDELIAEKKKCEIDVEEMRNTPPKSLWFRDLEALEKELDVSNAALCCFIDLFCSIISSPLCRYLIKWMQRTRKKEN